MEGHEAYPRERYEELEPLDSRGHVLLVRDRENGQLYVKKQICTHVPEVYRQLLRAPVEGTPTLYGVWSQGEAGADGLVPLIVLEEYLPGHTLAQQLLEQGPLNEEDCIRVGLHLCAILQRLHSRTPAIVHRDIKPSNVMLLPDGKIMLLDFSAAKLHAPREGRDTVLIGTAGFAAPEQYGFSASTVQTDIYGIGSLLSILRTGAMPWEQRAGGRLGPVLERCLRMDPRDRYQDVRELQLALKKARQQRFPWLPPGLSNHVLVQGHPGLRHILLPGHLFHSALSGKAVQRPFRPDQLPALRSAGLAAAAAVLQRLSGHPAVFPPDAQSPALGPGRGHGPVPHLAVASDLPGRGRGLDGI